MVKETLGISQVGKATDFDSVIHRFESCIPSQYDPLAQSVEHLTFNQGVPRSSRGWVTIYAGVAELADALDLGSSATSVGVRVPSPAPF